MDKKLDINQSTTVILRECGERTADYCHEQLCSIFSPNNVLRVSEKPFSLTLRRSLELGLKEGREFVLCIDADIIPIATELKNLVYQMSTLPRHVLELQGMVFDNLFRVARPAGNHIYRSSLVPKAIANIPLEGTSVRPESDMLSALILKGNPWKQSRLLVGYHDFEQNYDDIYRKAFLHCRKHAAFQPYLKELWTSLSHSQPEFVVACAAMSDFESYNGKVIVNKSFLAQEASERILGLKLQPLDSFPDNFKLQSITEMNKSLGSKLMPERDKCERTLDRLIFSSLRARLRRLLSSRLFQLFLS